MPCGVGASKVVVALALLAAIVIGGLVGMLVSYDPGYVMLHFGEWVIETSVWVAVLILVVFYLSVRGVVWLTRSLFKGQLSLVQWQSGRKARIARQQTVRGLLLMAEGRWEEAKKVFLKGVGHVETPLINYLNAARAAHELGDADERDAFLKRAHETTPGAKFAALLTQAEFQVKDGRFEQALAALLNLSKCAPKHKSVLAMLAQCYEALGDWGALHTHLKSLAKEKVVDEFELNRLSRLVWIFKLTNETNVEGTFKKMPKPIKSDLNLIDQWLDNLVASQHGDEAEALIRIVLDQQWNENLVIRYGLVGTTTVQKQIISARGWLKARPSDAELHVTLGRLYLRAEKFEEAREYFEGALRIQPSNEIYGELGRLCIALGDERRGADYLLQSVGGLPALPQPSEPVLRKGVSLGA